MKFKGLIVLLVLVVATATLFTAFAGHGSTARYMGSVRAERDSVARGGSASPDEDILVTDNILPVKACTGDQRPGDDGCGIPGKATCGNPGSKTFEAPGINYVDAFAGSKLVDSSQIDAQGHFHATVISTADVSNLDPAVLCPNGRWTVTDFTPTDFIAILVETAVVSLDGSPQKSLGYEKAHCYVDAGVEIKPGNPYTCDLLEVYHTGAPTS